MADSLPFRLGRLIPETVLPAIEFSAIRTSTPADAPAPLNIPPTVDYLSVHKTWEMLGNDSFGDCNAVAWANQRRFVTSKLGKKEVYPNIDQVVKFYKTQNPNFDPHGSPTTNGPGSPADGGMYIQAGLNYLLANGGPDGVKPVAFARVNVNSMDDVHAAVAAFGSLWIGFLVLNNNFTEFSAHKPWTVQPNSTIAGGHAVHVGGYLPDVKFVTWADVATFSDAFWKGSVNSQKIVDEAWVVIWPENIGSRSFMLGVDLAQLSAEYQKLTGRTLTLPSVPFNSLNFIKYRNAQSGKTEVHVATSSSAYTAVVHAVTPEILTDAQNGTWAVESDDVYFIKTRNTGSHTIEVHRLPSSRFNVWDLQTATGFSINDANNGIFTIDNGDLYFIKTRNVGSGFIEVHKANHETGFSVDFHAATAFRPDEVANGHIAFRGGNLYIIKSRNTTSGKVEVRVADGEQNWRTATSHVSWFSTVDDLNGSWQIGRKGDLYFIKTRNVMSHKIEVHVATAKSNYQVVSHYATAFSGNDALNGYWLV